jgi:LysR family hydrogen peroxide-inducible transcriptional activator
MTLQQFEYIIAVDRERHFAKAAEKCFVTQATLSMMVKKLEDELGVKIFDRSKQPVTVTRDGEEIIIRAKKILGESYMLREFVREMKSEVSGEVRIGIIPTLAPYLLPMFLRTFTDKFPHLNIKIRELITRDIVHHLRTGELDIGMLATPLQEAGLKEYPLFYEEYIAYAAKTENLPGKKYILPKHINTRHLWLLEEGHCMRNQMLNLCSLKKKDNHNLNYEAGSIETLINLVDNSHGITIIPRLATLKMTQLQRKKLHEFAPPKPAREISLVVNANFPRTKLIDYLREEIIKSVSVNSPAKNKGLKILTVINS